MKYKIFELIGKDRLEQDEYYTKTITSYKLEELDLGMKDNEFDSPEEAMNTIQNLATNFKCTKVSILPIIEIDYEGKVH